MRKWAIAVVVVLGLAAVWANADDAKVSTLKFTVLKSESGKPVRNASVILHPVDKNGRQARGGLQLKTDAEGKASLDAVPYGKLRVQVLAPGFQTYGEDYDIDSDAKEIVVKLKRPQKQYSIYDDLPGTPKKDSPPEKSEKPN
jgi:hypothetical protein